MLPTYLLFSRFLPYLQIGDKEIHMKRILIIGITLLTIGITAFSLINEKEPKENKSPTAEKDYPIDFSLEDKDGNKLSLSDYEGKVVVLNFWASWCGPCKMEMPDLEKFHEANKDGDIAVVAVALDRTFNTSINFMNNTGYSIPYFKPDGKVPSEFSISAIPVTFIIDKKGNIVTTYTGATDFGARYFLKDIELARK